jgi:hypothetical protein
VGGGEDLALVPDEAAVGLVEQDVAHAAVRPDTARGRVDTLRRQGPREGAHAAAASDVGEHAADDVGLARPGGHAVGVVAVAPSARHRLALLRARDVGAELTFGLPAHLEARDAGKHRRAEFAVGRRQVDLAVDGQDAGAGVDDLEEVAGVAEEPVEVDGDDDAGQALAQLVEHARPLRAGAAALRRAGVVVGVLPYDLPPARRGEGAAARELAVDALGDVFGLSGVNGGGLHGI